MAAGSSAAAPRVWTRNCFVLLVAGLAVAGLLRLILLPSQGLRDDTDQFAGWVHALAIGLPFGQLYRLDLTFGPTMGYVFGVLAAAVPAFASSPDAGDVVARTALKLPATLADLGIALGVAWLLRDRPRWAIAAALSVALVPTTWYLSSWWGQFDSIYVLLGLLAAILAIEGHAGASGVALGLAVLAKPQALPFLVPLAAFHLGRSVRRDGLRFTIGAGATLALLWLPFLADGGPGRYLAWLADYQNGIFAVLSLRAWNLWWLVQGAVAPGGDFLADSGALLGPLTPRLLGLLTAGLAELVVFLAVLRHPTRETLLLGLAAASLVAFCLLTTMHERYSVAALVFLAPLMPDRRVLVTWIALAAATTLNLIAAVPAMPVLGELVPIAGPAGVLGSLAMIGMTAVVVALLLGASAGPARAPMGSGEPA
jgi:hypothetical protein